MAKEVRDILASNPRMMFVISFFLMLLVNAVVIGLGNMLLPNNIVLGTMSLSPLWATILSAGTLSLITILALPFITEWENSRKKNLSPIEMMAAYLFINFSGVWLITRASEVFGLGISSWFFVLMLAIVLDFFQGMVMMQVEKMRKSTQ